VIVVPSTMERFGASTSESTAVILVPDLFNNTESEAVVEDFPAPPLPLTMIISFK